MTILEALNRANEQLKKYEIESPMLDAQVLLAHVLHVKKSWLFSHFDDELKPHHEELFMLSIHRRMKHEPVAYIIESKPFYGRSYFVNPSVLIPRPATETLVEEALKLLKEDEKNKTLVCDIGTGSGAIAITIALEASLPVIATDTSPQALAVAKQNAQLLHVEEIDVREGDLLEPIVSIFESIRSSNDPQVSSIYPYKHLIICANLPYLSTAQMETLDTDVRFEPVHALQAGPDGLDAYYQLFKQLARFRLLFPRRVSVLIEIDPSQTQKAVELITHSFPTSTPQIIQDLQGHDRVILVQV